MASNRPKASLAPEALSRIAHLPQALQDAVREELVYAKPFSSEDEQRPATTYCDLPRVFYPPQVYYALDVFRCTTFAWTLGVAAKNPVLLALGEAEPTQADLVKLEFLVAGVGLWLYYEAYSKRTLQAVEHEYAQLKSWAGSHAGRRGMVLALWELLRLLRDYDASSTGTSSSSPASTDSSSARSEPAPASIWTAISPDLAIVQKRALAALHGSVTFQISKAVALMASPEFGALDEEARARFHAALQDVIAVFGHLQDPLAGQYCASLKGYYEALFHACEEFNGVARSCGVRKVLITYEGLKNLFLGSNGVVALAGE